MSSNNENPHVGKKFQKTVVQALSQYFGKTFEMETGIPIGVPAKVHKFDCASLDQSIVVECKCFTWTVSGNIPSAKLAFLNQAAYYLNFLPKDTTKIILMKQTMPLREETLAEYYYRINHHLLQGIHVYEMDENSMEMKYIRTPRVNGSDVQLDPILIRKETIFSGGVEGGGLDLFKRTFSDGTHDFFTTVNNVMDFDEEDESKPVDTEIRFGSWGQAWTYLLETPLFIMVPLEVHPDYLSQFVDYIAKNEDQFKQKMGSRWERVMKPRWEALLKENGQRKAPQGDLFG